MPVENISRGEINEYKQYEENKVQNIRTDEYLRRMSFGFEDEVFRVQNYNVEYANFEDVVGINAVAKKSAISPASGVNAIQIEIFNNTELKKKLQTKINSLKITPVRLARYGKLDPSFWERQLKVSDHNLQVVQAIEPFDQVYITEVLKNGKDVNVVAERYQQMLAKFIKGGMDILSMDEAQLVELINTLQT